MGRNQLILIQILSYIYSHYIISVSIERMLPQFVYTLFDITNY